MILSRPSATTAVNTALIAVITTVLLAFGIFDYLQQRAERYETLHADIASVTEQLASSLALPLWNFQDDQAAKILENALLNKDVAAVLAQDTITQRVVAGRSQAGNGTQWAMSEAPVDPDLIVKSASISFNTRVIGQVTVWGTRKHVRQALRENLARMAAGVALVNAALVALLSLILSRTIIRPLKSVENYALAVSYRDEAGAEPPGGFRLAEVENLRDSIVLMVGKLGSRFEQLETSRAELAEAERRYRDLYENALAGVYRCGLDGELMSANMAMARILGYPSRQVLFEAVSNVSLQVFEQGPAVESFLRELVENGEVSGVRVRFRRSDGDMREGLLHGRMLLSGQDGPQVYDGMLDDITERIRAEAQLLEAHAFIQNILDAMPSQVIGIDGKLAITHVNAAARRASDESGSLTGKPLTQAFPRLTAYLEHIRWGLGQSKPVVLNNQPYVRGGQARQENLLIFPIARAGQPGAVIRLDDVTDQARMEELIMQSEKMMSLGGLAAGMAHEINNPLAGILQSVQNIQRRVSPVLPANQRAATQAGCGLENIVSYLELRDIFNFLTGIRESGERAARIVSNMLSFTRRTTAKPASTPLADLVDRCLELASTDYDLKKKFDFKRIEIVKEYKDRDIQAMCVPMEIEQVLLNLVRNAAQAMAQQPGADERPRIVVRIRSEGDQAVIEVADNGPGIEEKHLHRVFEPFYTTKPPGEGTGLGLSVSYFIITRNHGGTIRVRSKPGEGATFTITLPLGQAKSCLDPGLEEDNRRQA